MYRKSRPFLDFKLLEFYLYFSSGVWGIIIVTKKLNINMFIWQVAKQEDIGAFCQGNINRIKKIFSKYVFIFN